jgi:hypothetical protein
MTSRGAHRPEDNRKIKELQSTATRYVLRSGRAGNTLRNQHPFVNCGVLITSSFSSIETQPESASRTSFQLACLPPPQSCLGLRKTWGIPLGLRGVGNQLCTWCIYINLSAIRNNWIRSFKLTVTTYKTPPRHLPPNLNLILSGFCELSLLIQFPARLLNHSHEYDDIPRWRTCGLLPTK